MMERRFRWRPYCERRYIEQTIAGICKLRKRPNLIRFNIDVDVVESVEFELFDDIFSAVVLSNLSRSVKETNLWRIKRQILFLEYSS